MPFLGADYSLSANRRRMGARSIGGQQWRADHREHEGLVDAIAALICGSWLARSELENEAQAMYTTISRACSL